MRPKLSAWTPTSHHTYINGKNTPKSSVNVLNAENGSGEELLVQCKAVQLLVNISVQNNFKYIPTISASMIKRM